MQDKQADIAQLITDYVDDMAAGLADAGIFFPVNERIAFVEHITAVVLNSIRLYLTGYSAGLNFNAR